MRVIRQREHETQEHSPAAPDIARALAATKLVETSLTLDGMLRLRSGSLVGAVRVTAGQQQAELHVRPKIEIARLFWLLGYARDPRGWRDDPVGLTHEDELVPAMAAAFTATASRALAAGVLQGYRTVEDTLPLVRGRLREADQLRARPGLALPVEVRYDDYTADIPENQILLSAVRRLHRVPGIPPTARNALHRIAAALADATPLIAGAPVPDTPANRFNQRYQPALRLARLVLAGNSIEHGHGPTTASGYVFDLNSVFEQWLTTALRQAVEARYGGRVTGQYQMHLDDARQLPLVRPDITWWDGRRCLAAVDAKYKVLKKTPPPGDIYQMLAYCTALNLARGHLVYASPATTQPAEFRLTGSGVRIVVHSVDLSAPLAALQEQISQIAEAVAADAAPSR